MKAWRTADENKRSQDVWSRRNGHNHPCVSGLLQKEQVAGMLVRSRREVRDDGRLIGEQGRAE